MVNLDQALVAQLPDNDASLVDENLPHWEPTLAQKDDRILTVGSDYLNN